DGSILVVNPGEGLLSVIDRKCATPPPSPTPRCVSVIQGCRRDIPVGDGPEAVAVIPTSDRDVAFVTNRTGRSISIVDILGATPPPIPRNGSPYGVAFTPDGRYAYVTGTDNHGQGVVWVIDTLDPAVTPTQLAVGLDPRGVAVGEIAQPDCSCPPLNSEVQAAP